ncbi:DnaJ-like protein subfamily C member 17 [Plecturocebus cupreus]
MRGDEGLARGSQVIPEDGLEMDEADKAWGKGGEPAGGQRWLVLENTESVGLCPAVPDLSCPCSVCQGSVVSERDYESLVMMRLRQAAERQQLIARMQREDQEGPPT